MNIIERLHHEMHVESARIAPQTNGLIDAARTAIDEIERLRAALRECAKDSYFDDYDHDFKPTAAASVALAALDNEQQPVNDPTMHELYDVWKDKR